MPARFGLSNASTVMQFHRPRSFVNASKKAPDGLTRLRWPVSFQNVQDRSAQNAPLIALTARNL